MHELQSKQIKTIIMKRLMNESENDTMSAWSAIEEETNFNVLEIQPHCKPF